MARTFYLIDGYAQFFRAYFAIRTAMTSPVTREPTNLTYGFTSMLIKLLRDYQPDYVAVALDVSGEHGTFRNEIYPEYKANRDETPEDLPAQVERCLEILGMMGIPVLGHEGMEADDVIATLVNRLRTDDPDLEVRILSRDKDLSQLLRDGVELFDIHKDAGVTPADIFKTEGVEPRHVVDILSLMGDSADNIPGVEGIGPKTAAKLILQYGDIETIYEHIDEIKGKRHDNLLAAREHMELNRRLVLLRDDIDLEFDLESASIDPGEIPVQRLQELFRELGFNRQQDDIARLARSASTSSRQPVEPGGLFGSDEDEIRPADPDAVYTCVRTKNELEDVLHLVSQSGSVTFDTETTGLNPLQADLCGISLAIEAGKAWYIPVRSPEPGTHMDSGTVLAMLAPVMEDESILKIAHNLKFDLNVLRHAGLRLEGPFFDTMIASYVVDATRSSHGMDALALGLLGMDCIPISSLIGTGRNQKTFSEVPLETASIYAAEDADMTMRLHDVLSAELEQRGLVDLFETLEMPLVPVLADMEYTGIHVNAAELDHQREQLSTESEQLRRAAIDAAPHGFNPDSPRQLAAVLFNDPGQDPPGLGLTPVKQRKTGPSTDQEVLEKLDADPEIETPIPGIVLQYRKLAKLVGTYLVALKDAIDQQTGRVHASFHQTVTSTGRLSSSNPNLQNIPIRSEQGREIRKAFTAPPGRCLVAADYSQIELRLLADLSGDAGLIDAFRRGVDIHAAVAADVFDVPVDSVTSEQRDAAKMINFGIVYGITPWGLARRLGDTVNVEQAGIFIDDYKQRFEGIDLFLKACVKQAEQKGYVETIRGRRRMIPQVESRNPQTQALGRRLAINTVVQGSAADLIKMAMIDLDKRLGDHEEAKLLLQIHDELVIEAPLEEAVEMTAVLVETMESAMELRVPLVVDTAVGPNWYEAK